MRFLLLNEFDDEFLKNTLTEVLRPLGSLDVTSASKSVSLDDEELYGLIIIDATTVDRAEQLVSLLRLGHPERRVIVLTASPTWQRARAVFEAGAMDYLPKTLSTDDLREAFRQALRNPVPL